MRISCDLERKAVDFAPAKFAPRVHFIKTGLRCRSFLKTGNKLFIKILGVCFKYREIVRFQNNNNSYGYYSPGSKAVETLEE